jgi:hypothetical protein
MSTPVVCDRPAARANERRLMAIDIYHERSIDEIPGDQL